MRTIILEIPWTVFYPKHGRGSRPVGPMKCAGTAGVLLASSEDMIGQIESINPSSNKLSELRNAVRILRGSYLTILRCRVAILLCVTRSTRTPTPASKRYVAGVFRVFVVQNAA